MNATFTVTFKGIRSKHAVEQVEAWLREDIAFYPKRMKMDSATVKIVQPTSEKTARRFQKELQKASQPNPNSNPKGKLNA